MHLNVVNTDLHSLVHLQILRHVTLVQTQVWMTDHRRKVAAKMKAEKAKQQAPAQRRAVARQKAANSEVQQVHC